jgi:hypothetical protein
MSSFSGNGAPPMPNLQNMLSPEMGGMGEAPSDPAALQEAWMDLFPATDVPSDYSNANPVRGYNGEMLTDYAPMPFAPQVMGQDQGMGMEGGMGMGGMGGGMPGMPSQDPSMQQSQPPQSQLPEDDEMLQTYLDHASQVKDNSAEFQGNSAMMNKQSMQENDLLKKKNGIL